MQFSLTSYHFIPYQHSVLKHPQSTYRQLTLQSSDWHNNEIKSIYLISVYLETLQQSEVTKLVFFVHLLKLFIRKM
jgi:hypothetical protein